MPLEDPIRKSPSETNSKFIPSFSETWLEPTTTDPRVDLKVDPCVVEGGGFINLAN